MRKRAWVFVECDGEGCDSGALAEMKQLATGEWHEGLGLEMLEDVGWWFDDDGDFCPACEARRHKAPLPGACCDNERRNMNGGCDNCGDPSY